MRSERLKVLIPVTSLRARIAIWTASGILVWAVLVGGWLIARRQLTAIEERVASDIRALEAARDLELALLASRREDLLWEVTREPRHRERSAE